MPTMNGDERRLQMKTAETLGTPRVGFPIFGMIQEFGALCLWAIYGI